MALAQSNFQDALDALLSGVARMGGLSEALLNDAVSAVVRRDTHLAKFVIERDAKIDAAQREIERAATSLLLLRQTSPRELREILSALKIASDLERIGDLSKNIAKRALVLNLADPIQLTRSVERMGRMAAVQIKQVLDSYASRALEPAIAVWLQDEDVDAHYNSLFRELLTYMMEDPRTIGPCAHLLFIAKNIERIGDHATNIAETVHYLVTGEDFSSERPKATSIDRHADD